jgi:hypothetical protein
VQSFKVFNHGVEVEFKGRLLAQTDTRKTPEQQSWSEFQIYATEEGKFVVNVLKCHDDGLDTGRSFFCNDLYAVQEVLKHPIFGGISYKAQSCYHFARERAVKHGLIGADEFMLVVDAESKPIIPVRELPDFDDDDSFDFTE